MSVESWPLFSTHPYSAANMLLTNKIPKPAPRSVLENHNNIALCDLINSVENDIKLLNTLEDENDIFRSDNNDNNITSMDGSSKLLSLPGYRPNTGPPPLPSRHRHMSDTVINNLTVNNEEKEAGETDYSPHTPPSPEENRIADSVSHHTFNQCRPIYCPLCVGHFYHYQQLQDHLLEAHTEELQQLQNQNYQIFTAQTCPCCDAQFLKVSISSDRIIELICRFMDT